MLKQLYIYKLSDHIEQGYLTKIRKVKLTPEQSQKRKQEFPCDQEGYKAKAYWAREIVCAKVVF